MRLKRTANSPIYDFYKSKNTNKVIQIKHNDNFLPFRLVKYKLNGHVYMIGTTLLNASLKQIKFLYKRRWRIEVCFKRLKSHLHLNTIHARTEKLWLQEVQARILFDTLCRIIQLIAHKRKGRVKHKRGKYTVRFIHLIKTKLDASQTRSS